MSKTSKNFPPNLDPQAILRQIEGKPALEGETSTLELRKEKQEKMEKLRDNDR